MEKYKYRPISREKREIRLIKILDMQEKRYPLPDTADMSTLVEAVQSRLTIRDDTPLKCEIEHVSLDTKPLYCALSYSWGDNNNKRKLIVKTGADDETVILIAGNLDFALRNIPCAFPLWVDSICINQLDAVEKTWQVQQMLSIYRGSVMVAAWIGPAADESDLIMDQISLLQTDMVKDVKNIPKPQHMDAVKAWRPKERALSLPALSALLRRAYWSRVWIQQELFASDNVSIHCGQKVAPISFLAFALTKLVEMRNDRQTAGTTLVSRDSFEARLGFIVSHRSTNVVQRALNRQHLWKAGTLSFVELVRQVYVEGHGLKSSDSRDLLFALIGMCNDSNDFENYISYSVTEDRIYGMLAFLIMARIRLEILTWCNCNGKPPSEGELPSWAPDWSRPILMPLGVVSKSHKDSIGFNASLNAEATGNFPDGIGIFPAVSTIGYKVDEVFKVGKLLQKEDVDLLDHEKDDEDEDFELFKTWLEDLEQLSNHCRARYRTLDSWQEAIWKTPIADEEFTSQAEHRRASKDMQEGYKLIRAGKMKPVLNASMFNRIREDQNSKRYKAYHNVMRSRSRGRRYFNSETGYLGLGPAGVSPGDIITVIQGLNTAMVLRHAEQGFYRIVGEAYVHGIMNGEIVKAGNVAQTFNII